MTREAKKLLKTRLRHAKFISTLINLQPFVRAVILNGSLASGTVRATSDIDFLIITKSGRIYTARFFVTVAVWLTGLKRSNHDGLDHAGRICLNYYLTDKFLIIPHHRSEAINRYCAENYSKSLLLAGDKGVFEKFLAMNKGWMSRYLQDGEFAEDGSLASRGRNKGYVWKMVLENALAQRFGDRVERWLKTKQLQRIYSDQRARMYPDFIYADDREMRFHPPKVEVTGDRY